MSCRSNGSAVAPRWRRNRNPGWLLVVSSRAGVRLPDGHMLDADTALGQGGELLAGLVVEVFGQVLGRGVENNEGLEVVEHLVVNALDDRAQQMLEQLEVQQQAGRVQLRPGQGDADLVVVAVRVLALALVVAEVVSGGETCLHGDFKHGCLLDSVRGSAPESILVLFGTAFLHPTDEDLSVGPPMFSPSLFAAAVHLLEEMA